MNNEIENNQNAEVKIFKDVPEALKLNDDKDYNILNLIYEITSFKENIMLIVLSAIWWLLLFNFGYWNKNFDLISTITNYIVCASTASILIGMLKTCRYIARTGILVFMLTMLSLLCVKSINVIASSIGIWVLMPATTYYFQIMLKLMWNSHLLIATPKGEESK